MMNFSQWLINESLENIKTALIKAASPEARKHMIVSTHEAIKKIVKAINTQPNSPIVQKFVNSLRDYSIPSVPDQSDGWEVIKTLWNKANLAPTAVSPKITPQISSPVPQEEKNKFDYPMSATNIRSIVADAAKRIAGREPSSPVLTMIGLKSINSDRDVAEAIISALSQMGHKIDVNQLPKEYQPKKSVVQNEPGQTYSSNLGDRSEIKQIDPRKIGVNRDSRSVLNIPSLSSFNQSSPGSDIYQYLYVKANGKFYENPYFNS